MNNTDNKLQRGYHAMVENVESLIKKEGKSLEHALKVAEGKLKENKDLSIDQYKHIRSEVRHDLFSLGERLSDAKESFLHRMEMDSKFIKSRAVKKLSSIAEHTTQELVDLKDTLFNKDLEIDEIIQTEHMDHRQWHEDHSFWLTEISMWKKEHHDAGAKLLSIHDAIHDHAKSLDNHAQALRADDIMEYDHEIELANIEKGTANNESESDHIAHEQMKKIHKTHALLHQRCKNKHKEVMMLIERLHELTH